MTVLLLERAETFLAPKAVIFGVLFTGLQILVITQPLNPQLCQSNSL
jgi:hypothetical protein